MIRRIFAVTILAAILLLTQTLNYSRSAVGAGTNRSTVSWRDADGDGDSGNRGKAGISNSSSNSVGTSGRWKWPTNTGKIGSGVSSGGSWGTTSGNSNSGGGVNQLMRYMSRKQADEIINFGNRASNEGGSNLNLKRADDSGSGWNSGKRGMNEDTWSMNRRRADNDSNSRVADEGGLNLNLKRADDSGSGWNGGKRGMNEDTWQLKKRRADTDSNSGRRVANEGGWNLNIRRADNSGYGGWRATNERSWSNDERRSIANNGFVISRKLAAEIQDFVFHWSCKASNIKESGKVISVGDGWCMIQTPQKSEITFHIAQCTKIKYRPGFNKINVGDIADYEGYSQRNFTVAKLLTFN